jgi:hypothetical protein
LEVVAKHHRPRQEAEGREEGRLIHPPPFLINQPLVAADCDEGFFSGDR